MSVTQLIVHMPYGDNLSCENLLGRVTYLVGYGTEWWLKWDTANGPLKERAPVTVNIYMCSITGPNSIYANGF